MHYLDGLAKRVLQSARLSQDSDEKTAVAAVRAILEKEIAAGRLRYDTLPPFPFSPEARDFANDDSD